MRAGPTSPASPRWPSPMRQRGSCRRESSTRASCRASRNATRRSWGGRSPDPDPAVGPARRPSAHPRAALSRACQAAISAARCKVCAISSSAAQQRLALARIHREGHRLAPGRHHHLPAPGPRDAALPGLSSIAAAIRWMTSKGRRTGSSPFWKQLLWKMSPKLGAMTQRAPCPSASRPRPRGRSRSQNSRPPAGSARPGRAAGPAGSPGRPRNRSNRYRRRPGRPLPTRRCTGMIMSVSTLAQ